MSEINSGRAARGRVSLRGRRARASEGRFLCISRPAVDTTRGFGFVGSLDCQSAIHASRGRRHGAAVPSKAQCECVYIPGVVATVALAAVLGERRVTSRQWRARSTVRSARSPRARPTAASNASRRRAEDVAGVRASS